MKKGKSNKSNKAALPRRKSAESGIDVYQTASGGWRAYVKGHSGIEAWGANSREVINSLKRLPAYKAYANAVTNNTLTE